MSDPLRDIALFFEVAKAGSFTQAAANLDMPNSTLSRRIAELEQSLGARLLDRTTRSIALTEAGVAYLQRCERIMDEARRARDEIADFVQSPAGLLRISVSPDVGGMLLTPIILQFAKNNPNVTFELDLNPTRVDLLLGRFDVAIRVGPLPDSSLTTRRVFLIPSALAASPAYLDRAGVPRHPAELAKHSCLPLPHDHGEWFLTKDIETVRVQVSGRFAVNNMTMVRRLAKSGFGIAALSENSVRHNENRGLLTRVLPGWALPPVQISALTASRHLPAKTRAFVDFLSQKMSVQASGPEESGGA